VRGGGDRVNAHHAPTPRDPRQPRVDGGAVTQQVREILDEPASTLREELDQLTRAHDVLHGALQRG